MSAEQTVAEQHEYEITTPDQANSPEVSQEELGKVVGGYPGVAWSGPGDEGPEE